MAHPVRILLAFCLVVLAGGCSGKPTKVIVPKDTLPANTPINDSELNLMTRFNATFDAQSGGEYAKLLTDDFRFHFSVVMDPDLVSVYGSGWSRLDETTAVTHLFGGFRNSSGQAIPGASSVAMSLVGVQVLDDSSHVDSLAYYRKVVVSTMLLSIEVPSSYPEFYSFSSHQEFYVVRGDAAVLASGQASQVDRWYIRRWDDLTAPPYGSKNPGLESPMMTLGRIKAMYR